MGGGGGGPALTDLVLVKVKGRVYEVPSRAEKILSLANH